MKRILALLLCLCMVLATVPAAMAVTGNVSLSNGTAYDTVEAALSAAKPGTTVSLQTDMTTGQVIVPKGVQLDLNGYVLTADCIIVAKGQLSDSTNGAGKILVSQDMLMVIGDNNGILPVWDPANHCYLLTSVTYQQMANIGEDGTSAQYIFLPKFSNAEASALMADGGADNGISVKVLLSWKDGVSQQYYTYNDSLISKVFDGTNRWVFDLKITGIGGIEDMTACAVIESAAGGKSCNAGTAVTRPTAPQPTTYTVTFADHDGTVLKTETVESGKAATAPADPTRTGYIFAGWDKAFDNVTGNLTVTATYTKDNSVTLTVANEIAAAGDTRIDLMVSVENNPGIIGLTVKLEYDDAVLTATRAGTEVVFDELSYQKPANFKNGCKLIFYAAEVEEILDGEAFYIRFNVSDDAAPGTYPVKLIVEQALDTGNEDVAVAVVAGSIVVE